MSKPCKRFGRKWLGAMGMLCLVASTGCAPKTVYVRGDSQTVAVKAGQPAPRDGWLLSPAALTELLECCEGRAPAVEGVLFTSAHKLALATQGKQAFEDRKVRIPLGDAALRKDLHALKKTTTATGNSRFDADRDEGGHADRAWACFLGLAAAERPGGPIEYRTTGERRDAYGAFGDEPGLTRRGVSRGFSHFMRS